MSEGVRDSPDMCIGMHVEAQLIWRPPLHVCLHLTT